MMRRNISPLNSFGVSLVETVIAMGVVGTVLGGILSMNQWQMRSIRGNRLITTRDNLKVLAERYSMDMSTLLNSAEFTGNPGNVALKYCLYGPTDSSGGNTPPPSNCVGSDLVAKKCCMDTSAKPQPFVMLDPTDSNPTYALRMKFSGADPAALPLAAIAPTQAQPVRYRADGSRCTVASPECPLELVTAFVATCAGGAGTFCDRSSRVIQVQYKIRQAAGVTVQDASPLQPIVNFAAPVAAFSNAGIGSSGATLSTPTSKTDAGTDQDTGPSTSEETRPLTRMPSFTRDGEFVVPSEVTVIYATLIGGGGAGPAASGCTQGPYTPGGNGCVQLRTRIAVAPGENLKIRVGKGGSHSNDGLAQGGDSIILTTNNKPIIIAKGGHVGVGQDGYVLPKANCHSALTADLLFPPGGSRLLAVNPIDGYGLSNYQYYTAAEKDPSVSLVPEIDHAHYGKGGGITPPVEVRRNRITCPAGTDGTSGAIIIEY